MKVIIDSFEGEIAVIELENGDMVDVPKKILPANVKEGSIISITCEEGETEQRREDIKKKMDSIFRK